MTLKVWRFKYACNKNQVIIYYSVVTFFCTSDVSLQEKINLLCLVFTSMKGRLLAYPQLVQWHPFSSFSFSIISNG